MTPSHVPRATIAPPVTPAAREAVRTDLDLFFESPLASSELAPRARKLRTRLESQDVRTVVEIAAAAEPFVRAGHGPEAARFIRGYDGPGADKTAEFREKKAAAWDQ